ncbi:MAG TPA: hypothetical protein VGI87_04500 [Solirubrobacteraceae bacterium]
MRRTGVCMLALVAGATIACGPLAGTSMAWRITGKPGKGCPYGAFCIYPKRLTWRTGPEKHGIYYSYGAHNLRHQLGEHLVYNNQYPVNGRNAGVSFCFGYNGRGGRDTMLMNEHWAAMVDLTPVNSITLWVYESTFTKPWACHT